MKNKIVRNLIYAQISFFTCLIITILVTTAGFTQNHGLSFYGEHWRTVLPFALGFLLCDVFLLKAASYIRENKEYLQALDPLLRVLAVLLLLIILTPDNLNSFFNVMHTVASTMLFLFEMILAVWFTYRWRRNKLLWILLTAQFLAGIVAMLSEFQISRYLSEGSLLFQLFFGLLLVWSISKFIDQVNAG